MLKKFIALSIIFNFMTINTQVLAAEVQSFGRASDVQKIENLLIPANAEMHVMLTKDISSANLKIGSEITAVLKKNIILNNGKIIPKNSIISGNILNIASAKKAGKNAFVDSKFYSILTPNQEKYAIKARIKTVDETGVLKGSNFDKQLSKSVQISAASSAGGAITGGVFGTMVGGAAAGMAAGVIAGAILAGSWIIGRKGIDVYLPVGTNLLMEFEEPIKKI